MKNKQLQTVITFKKLKQLINNLSESLDDDSPILLLDRNDLFYHIREVQVLHDSDKSIVYAALYFEPIIIIDEAVERNGLDRNELALQRSMASSETTARAVMKILNSHGFFVLPIDEFGEMKKEIRNLKIVKAQNDELKEHMETLIEQSSVQREHIDRLLDRLKR